METVSCGWNQEEYNSTVVEYNNYRDESSNLKNKKYKIYDMTLIEKSFFNSSKETDNKVIDCSDGVFLDDDIQSICDVLSKQG